MLCQSGLYPGAVIHVPDATAGMVVVVVVVERGGLLVVVEPLPGLFALPGALVVAAPAPVSGGAEVVWVVVCALVGSVEVGSAVVVVDRAAPPAASRPGACAVATDPAASATATSAANAVARRVHHRMAAEATPYATGAARTTSTATPSADSVSSRAAMPPAARRSSSPRPSAARNSGGPATRTWSTGERWESLASVLARRTWASTSPTASSIAGSAGSPGATASGVGHGARWIEPSCHQLHTSSVTKGMIGANSRCSASRARRSAAMAEPAAVSPRAP